MRSYSTFCTYCGSVFQARDHVIPACTENIRTYSPKDCVSSCNDCNGMLGCLALHSIPERAAHVAQRLRSRPRIKKVLATAEWHPCELKELGYNLRRKVESSVELKRWILRRIANAEMVACGYKAEPIEDCFTHLIKKLADEILKHPDRD